MDSEQGRAEESRQDDSSRRGGHNRYVLIAVLAIVVVVTVMLLRQNMEPPPQQQQQPPPQADEQGERLNSQERFQQTMEQIAHVEDILARDSNNVDAWSALGNLYYDASMPEEAIHHYEKALELKPGDLHIRTDMATMIRAQGDSERAAELLNGVVADDSTFTQAWFNLGVIYTFDLKHAAQAVSAWERFLALEPQSQHADAVRKEIDRLKTEM